MKTFDNAQLTASQLSLLLSREISKDQLDASDSDKNPSITVAAARKQGIINKTKCFDARYDKLDEFDFAVAEMQTKGLNRDLEEKILTSKNCIAKMDLVGAFGFLKQFLTDEYLQKLKMALKSKLEFHTATGWAHYSAKVQVFTPQQILKM